MRHHLFLLPAALLLATAAGAQTAVLTRSGGVLGTSADFALQGDPGEIFILIPSLTNGPTPLSLFDPGDSRSLAVGLDQIPLWTIGFLNGAGQAAVSYPLAAEPALHGLPVYAQFVTWPGNPTRVDDISNYTAFPLTMPEASTYTVGEVSKEATGHALTRLADGRVLVSGGSKPLGASSVAVNELEVFDPATYSFTLRPEVMSQVRTAHTATRLADGRVLLCGGADSAGVITASVDLWDPAAGTVTPAAPMSVARTQHTATLLPDGRVFVAGGTSDFDFSDPLGALAAIHATTEAYNPSTNSWSPSASLPKPRVMHAASLAGDGRVLITGGIEVTYILGIPFADFSADCRAWNPTTGAMQDVSDFSGVRAGHAQLTLADGDVLVAGGADGNLITQVINPLASVRRYDVSANSWANVASMANARVYPNLLDAAGTVVAIGGLSTLDLATLTGAPVLDVETSGQPAIAWTTNGAMLLGRPLVLSAPIDGGRRILSVGSDGTGQTAEAYAVQ
ncbi:MAG: kelch repeat-containing protein [Planctomycetota bacterium]